MLDLFIIMSTKFTIVNYLIMLIHIVGKQAFPPVILPQQSTVKRIPGKPLSEGFYEIVNMSNNN